LVLEEGSLELGEVKPYDIVKDAVQGHCKIMDVSWWAGLGIGYEGADALEIELLTQPQEFVGHLRPFRSVFEL
jgi:hypothetical protein